MYVVLQFPSVLEAEIVRDELNAASEARTAEANGEDAKLGVLGDAADRIDTAIKEED